MMDWVKLERTEQLEEIMRSSHPIAIFKHSTRCHISSMALRNFESNWTVGPDKCLPYFLDLITYRDLSNEISRITGVVHESPQLLLIKNGEVIHSASHHSIDANEIASKLA
jgi:bacillithiol system protein YtxJ